jgi:hypothetical protein
MQQRGAAAAQTQHQRLLSPPLLRLPRLSRPRRKHRLLLPLQQQLLLVVVAAAALG